jgi:hypothetical protein
VSERVAGDTGGGPVTLQGTVWAWPIFSSIFLTDTKHFTFDKKRYKRWRFGVQLIEMPRFDVLTHLEFSVFGVFVFSLMSTVDCCVDINSLFVTHSLTHAAHALITLFISLYNLSSPIKHPMS